ncbi:MAG: right-handed parallel beta-helix repeat-containing protein, partial [candidate division WOR-3 bacterium]
EIKAEKIKTEKSRKKDKNGIVANCRWRNHQVPYLVEGYLYFEDVYSLTIDQGCVVGLTDGIEVSNNARLTATNVTFTSRYLLEDGYGYPGDWEGIWISDGNAFLQDCKIEYAGANDASIVIEELSENQQVIINGCKIKFSGTNGISILTDEEYCDIEISNCQISNCYECPVFIENANSVQSLRTGNEFFNNECNYIWIDNGYISRSCTWYNCGVPYYIENGLEVSDNPIIFTLSPGVIIGCGDYIYIDVSATLIANNVIFTSLNDIGGSRLEDWWGIEVAGSINLANCIIKYADYGIYLEGDEEESALIQNCQIHSCQCGIYVDADENLGLNIANTTVFNCEDVPIELHSADLLSGLKQGNDFSNNYYSVIYVCDDGYISKSGTWYNCQVPYLFDTDVRINDNAIITIMPNVILQFANCKFQIEDGAVIADGSAGTIVFTNYPEYCQNWQGIFFQSDNPLNRLKHCIIENGGSHPFYPANIICQSASPRISDCEIANSLGWGIILQNSNLDPDTLRRYNRFFNNDSGDIYVMLPGQVVNSDVIKSPSIKIKRPSIINRARENRKLQGAKKSINKSTLKIKQ